MKKTTLLTLSLLMLGLLQAQVGINTINPLVSLHVDAFKTDASTPEGIIAPRLTRAQLTAKDAQYTILHEGTFVYVTTIDGTASAKTVNVITVGYYYFDGTIWKHFNDKLQTADNGLSVTPSAKVQLGGDLIQNTQIDTKGHNLTVTGSGKVGIGTAAPSVKLDIETGGTSTTPVKGFKLRDGNEGFGKVLTDDGTGAGTWTIPSTSVAIEGKIPGPLSSPVGISVAGGVAAYTGMKITLPKGAYLVNFSVWAVARGDVEISNASRRAASVFLSYSDTRIDEISNLTGVSSVFLQRLFQPGPAGTLGEALDYYGSGSIPVTIGDNPSSSTNETTVYVWVFMSYQNYTSNATSKGIESFNNTPGSFGPYTQLYAIPFHVQ